MFMLLVLKRSMCIIIHGLLYIGYPRGAPPLKGDAAPCGQAGAWHMIDDYVRASKLFYRLGDALKRSMRINIDI